MSDILRIDPYAYTYYNNIEKPQNIKMALASRELARYADIWIDPKTYMCYASYLTKHSAVHYKFGDGFAFNGGKAEENYKEFPDLADELRKIYSAIQPQTTGAILGPTRDGYEDALSCAGACWGGGWAGHANPDYDLLLHAGTKGLREKIAKYKAINTDDPGFYEGCEIMMDAIDILGDRFHELALSKAAETEDTAVKAEYEEIAKIFEVIPRDPAYDIRSAIQLFWLVFTFDGVDSPGRLDQFMIDYWRATEDKEDALKQFERMWEAFHDTRTWNLCISGSDENWNDNSNELTYVILDCCEKFHYQTPNVTMRVHRNTPEKLWKRAAEVIATGIGMPALYNDEVVCIALEKMGIPACHSHLYCMNGCNQIDIFGKSHMGLEDGEISVIKALEFALFRGVCQFSMEPLAPDTGDPTAFTTFDELMSAYKKQIEYLADYITETSNKAQEIFAKEAPNPWKSIMVQGCIEKGLDYKNRGPIYGHGQVLTEGLPDTVDSLAAIKHFIYDTKKYSMKELIDALTKNFEGYDELYRDFSGYDKFGNNIDEVDTIYAEVTDHIYRYFKTKKTYRGGVFGVGCSTFHRAPNYGFHCGALPNGKKRGGKLLADSIGATPGNDVCGPTALLSSVMRGNQYLATSGNVLQMKFLKSQFCKPEGRAAFTALAETYFAHGGQTLQINVLSREDLLDAQKNPENHKNLIVRVGGFSEYFIKLAEPLQENIIKRTEN